MMKTSVPMEIFEHLGAMSVLLKTKILSPSEKVRDVTNKLEEIYNLLGLEFKKDV